MTDRAPQPRLSAPPAPQLRLLANLAPPAALMFALFTVWVAASTLQNLALPMTRLVVIALVLGVLTTVVAALVTYRLGVEVPRVLRGWQDALAERTDSLRDR